MSKIELSEKQKTVLQKHFDGKYSPFFSTEEEQKAFNEVIEMAEKLMLELDAVEESGDDLMKWFWEKYQKQGN